MSGGSKIASTVDIDATVFYPGRIIPRDDYHGVIHIPRTGETITFHQLNDRTLEVDDPTVDPNKHAAYWIKRLVDGPEDPG